MMVNNSSLGETSSRMMETSVETKLPQGKLETSKKK